MGKGAALKTGIRYASVKYPESCGYITADADGQHSAEDILKVAGELEKNPDCLVLGTRDFSQNEVPFKSKWGNRITSLVFQLSTGQKCPDTQTGLRGIPKTALDICLSVPGDRFEYEMNMLLEFRKNRIKFIQVPIATIYIDSNHSSHFHPLRDSALIYFNILKYSLSSLTSAVVDISIFTILINIISSSGTYKILAATVIARLISGYLNFMLNRHWVFKSKNEQSRDMVQYFVLFCCQMMLSWTFVTILSLLPVNLTIIKMLVDGTLFLISYKIQKDYIFTKKRKGVPGNEKVFYKAS